MHELVITDEREEFILCTYIATIKVEEVRLDRRMAQLLLVLLKEESVLLVSVRLKEVVEFKRRFAREEVEDKERVEVEEGEQKRDEYVAEKALAVQAADDLRDYHNVERLVVLSNAREARNLSKLNRTRLIAVERGEKRVGGNFPGLIGNAGDHLDCLELLIRRLLAVDQVSGTYKKLAEYACYETSLVMVVRSSVLLAALRIVERYSKKLMLANIIVHNPYCSMMKPGGGTHSFRSII